MPGSVTRDELEYNSDRSILWRKVYFVEMRHYLVKGLFYGEKSSLWRKEVYYMEKGLFCVEKSSLWRKEVNWWRKEVYSMEKCLFCGERKSFPWRNVYSVEKGLFCGERSIVWTDKTTLDIHFYEGMQNL